MIMEILRQAEGKRRQVQDRLDLAMEAELRNRKGQYATPSALADSIIAVCWDYWKQERSSIRFLEPCVGTGSFYSSLRRIFPADLIESALACEVDQSHAAAARSLWGDAGLHVKNADFLKQIPPRKKYNLLITNPPYVRHHHIGQARKEELQALVHERLHLRISGLAGLYCYFLLLADAWLDDGGLSVWLIPSEFMDVNYGIAVKEYLTRRVRLLRIHRFSPTDVQFGDALVSSTIVIFEKLPPEDQEIVFSLGGSLGCPAEQVTLRPSDLSPGEKWTKYNDRVPGDSSPVHGSILFGDLFTIKRGLATGNNDFFILPRAKAREIGIPDQFLRPILPSPRFIGNPVIEADDSGYPKLSPQLVLIDCRLPEDAVAKKFPHFWEHLLLGRRKGIDQGYLTSRRNPWYSQEDRPAPPFVCTYMGRADNGRKPFRFLWNKSQATAHNVYLLLYPKGPLQTALARNISLYQKVFQALQSLNTDEIKGNGRVYGGGLFKMEPKELAKIPADFLTDAVALKEPVPPRQQNLFDSF
jgi:hypothetical protein